MDYKEQNNPPRERSNQHDCDLEDAEGVTEPLPDDEDFEEDCDIDSFLLDSVSCELDLADDWGYDYVTARPSRKW